MLPIALAFACNAGRRRMFVLKAQPLLFKTPRCTCITVVPKAGTNNTSLFQASYVFVKAAFTHALVPLSVSSCRRVGEAGRPNTDSLPGAQPPLHTPLNLCRRKTAQHQMPARFPYCRWHGLGALYCEKRLHGPSTSHEYKHYPASPDNLLRTPGTPERPKRVPFHFWGAVE